MERVRLLGINAPELSTSTGIAAKEQMEELVQPGTRVQLLASGMQDRDHYGRLLRQVFVEEANVTDPTASLSAQLAGLGYAKPYLVETAYDRPIVSLALQAIASGQGWWLNEYPKEYAEWYKDILQGYEAIRKAGLEYGYETMLAKPQRQLRAYAYQVAENIAERWPEISVPSETYVKYFEDLHYLSELQVFRAVLAGVGIGSGQETEDYMRWLLHIDTDRIAPTDYELSQRVQGLLEQHKIQFPALQILIDPRTLIQGAVQTMLNIGEPGNNFADIMQNLWYTGLRSTIGPPVYYSLPFWISLNLPFLGWGKNVDLDIQHKFLLWDKLVQWPWEYPTGEQALINLPFSELGRDVREWAETGDTGWFLNRLIYQGQPPEGLPSWMVFPEEEHEPHSRVTLPNKRPIALYDRLDVIQFLQNTPDWDEASNTWRGHTIFEIMTMDTTTLRRELNQDLWEVKCSPENYLRGLLAPGTTAVHVTRDEALFGLLRVQTYAPEFHTEYFGKVPVYMYDSLEDWSQGYYQSSLIDWYTNRGRRTFPYEGPFRPDWGVLDADTWNDLISNKLTDFLSSYARLEGRKQLFQMGASISGFSMLAGGGAALSIAAQELYELELLRGTTTIIPLPIPVERPWETWNEEAIKNIISGSFDILLFGLWPFVPGDSLLAQGLVGKGFEMVARGLGKAAAPVLERLSLWMARQTSDALSVAGRLATMDVVMPEFKETLLKGITESSVPEVLKSMGLGLEGVNKVSSILEEMQDAVNALTWISDQNTELIQTNLTKLATSNEKLERELNSLLTSTKLSGAQRAELERYINQTVDPIRQKADSFLTKYDRLLREAGRKTLLPSEWAELDKRVLQGLDARLQEATGKLPWLEELSQLNYLTQNPQILSSNLLSVSSALGESISHPGDMLAQASLKDSLKKFAESLPQHGPGKELRAKLMQMSGLSDTSLIEETKKLLVDFQSFQNYLPSALSNPVIQAVFDYQSILAKQGLNLPAGITWEDISRELPYASKVVQEQAKLSSFMDMPVETVKHKIEEYFFAEIPRKELSEMLGQVQNLVQQFSGDVWAKTAPENIDRLRLALAFEYKYLSDYYRLVPGAQFVPLEKLIADWQWKSGETIKTLIGQGLLPPGFEGKTMAEVVDELVRTGGAIPNKSNLAEYLFSGLTGSDARETFRVLTQTLLTPEEAIEKFPQISNRVESYLSTFLKRHAEFSPSDFVSGSQKLSLIQNQAAAGDQAAQQILDQINATLGYKPGAGITSSMYSLGITDYSSVIASDAARESFLEITNKIDDFLRFHPHGSPASWQGLSDMVQEFSRGSYSDKQALLQALSKLKTGFIGKGLSEEAIVERVLDLGLKPASLDDLEKLTAFHELFQKIYNADFAGLDEAIKELQAKLPKGQELVALRATYYGEELDKLVRSFIYVDEKIPKKFEGLHEVFTGWTPKTLEILSSADPVAALFEFMATKGVITEQTSKYLAGMGTRLRPFLVDTIPNLTEMKKAMDEALLDYFIKGQRLFETPYETIVKVTDVEDLWNYILRGYRITTDIVPIGQHFAISITELPAEARALLKNYFLERVESFSSLSKFLQIAEIKPVAGETIIQPEFLRTLSYSLISETSALKTIVEKEFDPAVLEKLGDFGSVIHEILEDLVAGKVTWSDVDIVLTRKLSAVLGKANLSVGGATVSQELKDQLMASARRILNAVRDDHLLDIILTSSRTGESTFDIERAISGTFMVEGRPAKFRGLIDVYDTKNRIIYDFKISSYQEGAPLQLWMYAEMLYQETGQRPTSVAYLVLSRAEKEGVYIPLRPSEAVKRYIVDEATGDLLDETGKVVLSSEQAKTMISSATKELMAQGEIYRPAQVTQKLEAVIRFAGTEIHGYGASDVEALYDALRQVNVDELRKVIWEKLGQGIRLPTGVARAAVMEGTKGGFLGRMFLESVTPEEEILLKSFSESHFILPEGTEDWILRTVLEEGFQQRHARYIADIRATAEGFKVSIYGRGQIPKGETRIPIELLAQGVAGTEEEALKLAEKLIPLQSSFFDTQALFFVTQTAENIALETTEGTQTFLSEQAKRELRSALQPLLRRAALGKRLTTEEIDKIYEILMKYLKGSEDFMDFLSSLTERFGVADIRKALAYYLENRARATEFLQLLSGISRQSSVETFKQVVSKIYEFERTTLPVKYPFEKIAKGSRPGWEKTITVLREGKYISGASEEEVRNLILQNLLENGGWQQLISNVDPVLRDYLRLYQATLGLYKGTLDFTKLFQAIARSGVVSSPLNRAVKLLQAYQAFEKLPESQRTLLALMSYVNRMEKGYEQRTLQGTLDKYIRAVLKESGIEQPPIPVWHGEEIKSATEWYSLREAMVMADQYETWSQGWEYFKWQRKYFEVAQDFLTAMQQGKEIPNSVLDAIYKALEEEGITRPSEDLSKLYKATRDIYEIPFDAASRVIKAGTLVTKEEATKYVALTYAFLRWTEQGVRIGGFTFRPYVFANVLPRIYRGQLRYFYDPFTKEYTKTRFTGGLAFALMPEVMFGAYFLPYSKKLGQSALRAARIMRSALGRGEGLTNALNRAWRLELSGTLRRETVRNLQNILYDTFFSYATAATAVSRYWESPLTTAALRFPLALIPGATLIKGLEEFKKIPSEEFQKQFEDVYQQLAVTELMARFWMQNDMQAYMEAHGAILESMEAYWNYYMLKSKEADIMAQAEKQEQSKSQYQLRARGRRVWIEKAPSQPSIREEYQAELQKVEEQKIAADQRMEKATKLLQEHEIYARYMPEPYSKEMEAMVQEFIPDFALSRVERWREEWTGFNWYYQLNLENIYNMIFEQPEGLTATDTAYRQIINLEKYFAGVATLGGADFKKDLENVIASLNKLRDMGVVLPLHPAEDLLGWVSLIQSMEDDLKNPPAELSPDKSPFNFATKIFESWRKGLISLAHDAITDTMNVLDSIAQMLKPEEIISQIKSKASENLSRQSIGVRLAAAQMQLAEAQGLPTREAWERGYAELVAVYQNAKSILEKAEKLPDTEEKQSYVNWAELQVTQAAIDLASWKKYYPRENQGGFWEIYPVHPGARFEGVYHPPSPEQQQTWEEQWMNYLFEKYHIHLYTGEEKKKKKEEVFPSKSTPVDIFPDIVKGGDKLLGGWKNLLAYFQSFDLLAKSGAKTKTSLEMWKAQTTPTWDKIRSWLKSPDFTLSKNLDILEAIRAKKNVVINRINNIQVVGYTGDPQELAEALKSELNKMRGDIVSKMHVNA